MRNLIDIINEAQRPTALKTRTADLDSLKPSLTTSTLSNVAPMGRQSTAMATQQAFANANVQVPADVLSGAMALDVQDELSNHEAAMAAGHTVGVTDEPKNPDNLPAMISRELERTDAQFDPMWHQVKHLPGYLQNAIRGTARQVFDRFTKTPIEDIQMMCTILDPEVDVRKMMAWIMNNGQEVDKMTFDFSAQIAGYKADFSIWRAAGYEFGLCHDMGGYYVYGWPEAEAQVTDRSDRMAQLGSTPRIG